MSDDGGHSDDGEDDDADADGMLVRPHCFLAPAPSAGPASIAGIDLAPRARSELSSSRGPSSVANLRKSALANTSRAVATNPQGCLCRRT